MTIQEAHQAIVENNYLLGNAESATGNKLTRLLIAPRPIYDHVKPIIESVLNNQDYAGYLNQFDDFTVMMIFGDIRVGQFKSVDDLERYIQAQNL
ncbi:hypothetical protein [Pedobacter jeongneungensis]|uniref:hypothetical protein n=1 Tax=Pedobacter jeongneungensis TaxID=947309 RepID=UPI000A476D66|nr:hypothetical protein [Pedobacter jeongneungensis]